MQKIATRIFIYASVVFGGLGILTIVTNAGDHGILWNLVRVTVFIILPSFALSVAGKYLGGGKS